MVSTEALRHLACVASLVVRLLLEDHREGARPLRRNLPHQADHGAGINPAGEEGCHGHVAHEMGGHRLAQELADPHASFVSADGASFRRRALEEVPVASTGDRPIGVHREPMAWLQHLHTFNERARGRHGLMA